MQVIVPYENSNQEKKSESLPKLGCSHIQNETIVEQLTFGFLAYTAFQARCLHSSLDLLFMV